MGKTPATLRYSATSRRELVKLARWRVLVAARVSNVARAYIESVPSSRGARAGVAAGVGGGGRAP